MEHTDCAYCNKEKSTLIYVASLNDWMCEMCQEIYETEVETNVPPKQNRNQPAKTNGN